MADIFQKQQQFFQRQISQPRFCSFCGKELLLCPTDEHNNPNPNYQWEFQNRAHMKCVEANYRNKVMKGGHK